MYARSLLSAFAGLVVAASCLGAVAADAPVLLSWKFKKGDQRHYVFERKMSFEVNDDGQASEIESWETIESSGPLTASVPMAPHK